MPVLTSILPIAASAGASGTASMLPTILMVVAMIAIFYFLLIRPENKKKKAANEMRNSLKPGDEITTIGGIVGTNCNDNIAGSRIWPNNEHQSYHKCKENTNKGIIHCFHKFYIF